MSVLLEPAEWESRLVAYLSAATRLALLPAETTAPDRVASVQIDFSLSLPASYNSLIIFKNRVLASCVIVHSINPAKRISTFF